MRAWLLIVSAGASRIALLLASLVASLVALGGCPNDTPPACVDVATTCQELYPPTFTNIYTNTLADTCGSQRVSCHSREGMKGGMSFDDPATAYGALLAGRVTPGDPGCSLMIVRAGSPGADYQMPPPPATALKAAELCSIVKWIANGAPGPTVAPEPSTEVP